VDHRLLIPAVVAGLDITDRQAQPDQGVQVAEGVAMLRVQQELLERQILAVVAVVAVIILWVATAAPALLS
jgi:hypothetical protein